MLEPYMDALRLPGAKAFSASAFVARLPIAMSALGIVLLVSGISGSYALAGALAAFFQLGIAGGTIISSRIVDQFGQRRTLPLLAGAHALTLAGFVWCVEARLPTTVQAVAAVIAGVSQPAIGSMVRARWATAASTAAQLRGAFALESIIDEVIFTLGPLLTALLAFNVGLPVPVIVAGVLTLAGSLALAVQRRTEPKPTGRNRAAGARGSAISAPGMVLMALAAVGVGAVFGSYEVTVVAFTHGAGKSGASGVVLGLWALGSMLGGIYFGARHWRVPLARQLLAMSTLLCVVLIPAGFVGSVPVLAVTTFVAGIAIAPVLISIFSLVERLVPAAQLTEGLTWATSSMSLGFSSGTSIAGVVVDAVGTSWAFAIPVVSAAAASGVAAAGQSVLLRASRGKDEPAPTAAWTDDPIPGPRPWAGGDNRQETDTN